MNERKSLLESRPDPRLSAIAFPCSESNSGSLFADLSLASRLPLARFSLAVRYWLPATGCTSIPSACTYPAFTRPFAN